MFFPEGQVRVYLYRALCDMRKSFNGLTALVKNAMGKDPLSVRSALMGEGQRRGGCGTKMGDRKVAAREGVKQDGNSP